MGVLYRIVPPQKVNLFSKYFPDETFFIKKFRPGYFANEKSPGWINSPRR